MKDACYSKVIELKKYNYGKDSSLDKVGRQE